ncbi:16S rRNA methyltransferase [Thioploca ingrica]|uniref:Ribosomal RNA small subunit methyltransferase G n=1 Tax=Thioploca ingrica TaxID=40754 RepID=A0A090AF62_9GAMM|nr:16S rRNA methyltransferase [Thioploca ingrica]
MKLATELQQGLQALPLHLPPLTQTQLLNYLELLAQWNQVYNLTAIRDLAEMIPKHVLDSLAILPYVQGNTLVDVGTGAGLPGLLLAIACPQWQCLLLDSNAKKIRFVKQAILELQINNAQAICTRVEAFNPPIGFNTVITRAYANLHHFYSTTKHLGIPGGYLLAMKGVYPATEIAQLAQLPVQLKCLPIQVPQLPAQRHVVLMGPL